MHEPETPPSASDYSYEVTTESYFFAASLAPTKAGIHDHLAGWLFHARGVIKAEALRNARDVMQRKLDNALENGEPIPDPKDVSKAWKPSEVSPETKRGDKFDAGKPMLRLLPPKAVFAVARVLTFGAKKYAPDNWRKVDNAKERYTDALLRHVFAWLGGERNDHESGEHHLAHAACCALFLLELEESSE